MKPAPAPPSSHHCTSRSSLPKDLLSYSLTNSLLLQLLFNPSASFSHRSSALLNHNAGYVELLLPLVQAINSFMTTDKLKYTALFDSLATIFENDVHSKAVPVLGASSSIDCAPPVIDTRSLGSNNVEWTSYKRNNQKRGLAILSKLDSDEPLKPKNSFYAFARIGETINFVDNTLSNGSSFNTAIEQSVTKPLCKQNEPDRDIACRSVSQSSNAPQPDIPPPVHEQQPPSSLTSMPICTPGERAMPPSTTPPLLGELDAGKASNTAAVADHTSALPSPRAQSIRTFLRSSSSRKTPLTPSVFVANLSVGPSSHSVRPALPSAGPTQKGQSPPPTNKSPSSSLPRSLSRDGNLVQDQYSSGAPDHRTTDRRKSPVKFARGRLQKKRGQQSSPRRCFAATQQEPPYSGSHKEESAVTRELESNIPASPSKEQANSDIPSISSKDNNPPHTARTLFDIDDELKKLPVPRKNSKGARKHNPFLDAKPCVSFCASEVSEVKSAKSSEKSLISSISEGIAIPEKERALLQRSFGKATHDERSPKRRRLLSKNAHEGAKQERLGLISMQRDEKDNLQKECNLDITLPEPNTTKSTAQQLQEEVSASGSCERPIRQNRGSAQGKRRKASKKKRPAKILDAKAVPRTEYKRKLGKRMTSGTAEGEGNEGTSSGTSTPTDSRRPKRQRRLSVKGEESEQSEKRLMLNPIETEAKPGKRVSGSARKGSRKASSELLEVGGSGKGPETDAAISNADFLKGSNDISSLYPPIVGENADGALVEQHVIHLTQEIFEKGCAFCRSAQLPENADGALVEQHLIHLTQEIFEKECAFCRSAQLPVGSTKLPVPAGMTLGDVSSITKGSNFESVGMDDDESNVPLGCKKRLHSKRKTKGSSKRARSTNVGIDVEENIIEASKEPRSSTVTKVVLRVSSKSIENKSDLQEQYAREKKPVVNSPKAQKIRKAMKARDFCSKNNIKKPSAQAHRAAADSEEVASGVVSPRRAPLRRSSRKSRKRSLTLDELSDEEEPRLRKSTSSLIKQHKSGSSRKIEVLKTSASRFAETPSEVRRSRRISARKEKAEEAMHLTGSDSTPAGKEMIDLTLSISDDDTTDAEETSESVESPVAETLRQLEELTVEETVKPLRERPKCKYLNPLTKDDEVILSNKMRCKARDKIVLIKEANVVITGDSFRRLHRKRWLDDEIINAYTAMINSRNDLIFESLKEDERKGIPRTYVFNTYFFTRLTMTEEGIDYEGVAKWTKRAGVDILEHDLILVPVNLGNLHWVLAGIDLSKKAVFYLDTMKGRDNASVVSSLKLWLDAELREKHGNAVADEHDVKSWEEVMHSYRIRRFGVIPDNLEPLHADSEKMVPVPRQTDGHSCGVFTARIADCLSLGITVYFSQKDMDLLRKRMALDLLNRYLPM